jgi:Tfp pilus assembly protein PilX
MELGLWGRVLLYWVIAIILIAVLGSLDLGFTGVLLLIAMIWYTARVFKADRNVKKAEANLRTAEANLEKAKATISQPAPSQTCPQCSAPINPGSNFCRNCGFKLS